MRQALAANAEPRRPDDGHGGPRTNTSSNDGLATIAAGVIVIVRVAVVGTAGLMVVAQVVVKAIVMAMATARHSRSQ
eukprot:9671929-Alexandrium_andersonii.AAC.1